jgi:TRAP-type C4-dicarboxylate transport system substrate-binding protein
MGRLTQFLSLCATASLAVTAVLPAKAAEEVKLTLSTYYPQSYQHLYDPLENFAKNVEKMSEGRIKVDFFHSGQLFGGKEELGALERGEIDISAPLDIYHTGAVPELGIASLPFLWPSVASVQKTIDAGLWDQGIKQALDKRNIVVLNVIAGDPYQVYAKEDPVLKPEDFKGRKWAVSGTTASKAVQLMGGAPTTMSSGELYLALQRGTIDGTTRPLITGLGRKLYEVNKHMTFLNMAYYSSFLSMNKEKWNSLPADLQQVLKDAAAIRGKEAHASVLAFMDSVKTKFREAGVEVHELDDKALANFKGRMNPVYDWWKEQLPNAAELIEFARNNQ